MAYIGKSPAKLPLTSSDVADDIITLAKMPGGTDGNIITYDASGDPAVVATGTSGHFLKSQGAGSVPVFAAAGGGKILQVVSGKYDASSEWSTTSTSYTDVTGMTLNITPSATSSKILVNFTLNGARSNSTSVNAVFTIHRGSDLSGETFGFTHTYTATPAVQTCMFVDSPSTTSQITYKVQGKVDGSGTCYAYRADTSNTFFAMEIGA